MLLLPHVNCQRVCFSYLFLILKINCCMWHKAARHTTVNGMPMRWWSRRSLSIGALTLRRAITATSGHLLYCACGIGIKQGDATLVVAGVRAHTHHAASIWSCDLYAVDVQHGFVGAQHDRHEYERYNWFCTGWEHEKSCGGVRWSVCGVSLMSQRMVCVWQ